MMFLMHIAGLMALITLAGGLVALHVARKQTGACLKIAGWVLIVGGALNFACNGYYGVKYWRAGCFDTPGQPEGMNLC